MVALAPAAIQVLLSRHKSSEDAETLDLNADSEETLETEGNGDSDSGKHVPVASATSAVTWPLRSSQDAANQRQSLDELQNDKLSTAEH